MPAASQSEIRMLLFPGRLRDSAATWIGNHFIYFLGGGGGGVLCLKLSISV